MHGSKRLNAWINGAALRDADARVIVVAITEDNYEIESEFAGYLTRPGRAVTKRPIRRSLTVRIEIAIREVHDLTARAAVLETVNAWAQDGYLQISSRPGRRLNVICTRRAAGGNLKSYTNTFVLEFQTTGIPYWESDEASAMTPGIAGEVTVPGTAQTVAELEITPEDDIDNLVITASGNGGESYYQMTFDVAAEADSTIHIYHDAYGYLRATKIYGRQVTNILNKRTADSDDDLFIVPGQGHVFAHASYEETDVDCAVTAKIRGRWL